MRTADVIAGVTAAAMAGVLDGAIFGRTVEGTAADLNVMMMHEANFVADTVTTLSMSVEQGTDAVQGIAMIQEVVMGAYGIAHDLVMAWCAWLVRYQWEGTRSQLRTCQRI
mmetsp:Transcript_75975/g.176251  ORF Transcript_75975/g.176251 Transcript_75975/m.176251 type:complete len:111 (-) Transcript_75975:352-684(-)